MRARPELWLPDQLPAVRTAIETLVDDVVGSVNFYVEDRRAEDDEFDPKVAFKSQAGVRALEAEVLRSARRQARRDPDFLFKVDPVR